MTRSIFTLATDYRGQSFEDLVSDLDLIIDEVAMQQAKAYQIYNERLSERALEFLANYVPAMGRSISLCETIFADGKTILEDFKDNSISAKGINRLRELGSLSFDTAKDLGREWNNKPSAQKLARPEDAPDPETFVTPSDRVWFELDGWGQDLYITSRDALHVATDLMAIADGLKHWIGSKFPQNASAAPDMKATEAASAPEVEAKTPTDYVREAIKFFKNEYKRVGVSGLKYEYYLGEEYAGINTIEYSDEYAHRLKAIKRLTEAGLITEYTTEGITNDAGTWAFAICKIDESKLIQKDEARATKAGAREPMQKSQATDGGRFSIAVKDREIWINDYLLSKPHAVGSNFEFFEHIRSLPANTAVERDKLPAVGTTTSLKTQVRTKSFIKMLNELGFKGEILKAFFPKRGKDVLVYRGDTITAEDLEGSGVKRALFLKQLEVAHTKNSPE